MALLKLMILNNEDKILLSKQAEDEVTIAYRGKYNPGDKIKLVSDTNNIYLKLRLDDSLDESWIYLKDYQYTFEIPFDDQRKPYGNKAFSDIRHFGYVSSIDKSELGNYRNVAKNCFDALDNNTLYPHASTNVANLNPQFFPRNAIDGIFETSNHGSWPHESWGINQQSDAWLKIDFGKAVEIDKVYIYLRADFPHDNWWQEGMITFSDGSKMKVNFVKTGRRQVIEFEPRKVEWIMLSNLKMSDEESLFPALSQIMVMGKSD